FWLARWKSCEASAGALTVGAKTVSDLRNDLNELERKYRDSLPSADEYASRFREISERSRARPRIWLWVGFPAAAALAWVATMVALRSPETDAWVKSENQCVHLASQRLEIDKDCASVTPVTLPGATATLDPGSQLERLSSEPGVEAFHLRRGKIRVSVSPRPSLEKSWSIRVSQARIRVVGTEFTVVQSADVQKSGELRVHEGIVEVQWDIGGAERVSAGERVSWPRAAPAEPPPGSRAEGRSEASSKSSAEPAPVESSRKRRPRAESERLDADEVLDRLFQLRSQQRQDEAAELLRRASKAKELPMSKRERFSTELGLLLEQTRSAEVACDHWKRHIRRFGRSKSQTASERWDRCR
ncbi:MAG: FecR domain-containing protein, partial [Myxococcota bacterium]